MSSLYVCVFSLSLSMCFSCSVEWGRSSCAGVTWEPRRRGTKKWAQVICVNKRTVHVFNALCKFERRTKYSVLSNKNHKFERIGPACVCLLAGGCSDGKLSGFIILFSEKLEFYLHTSYLFCEEQRCKIRRIFWEPGCQQTFTNTAESKL